MCSNMVILVLLVLLPWVSSEVSKMPRPTVHQMKHLNVDEITPTPSSGQYRDCVEFIRGEQWSCWENAESTLNVAMENFLAPKSTYTADDCCAIWYSERCTEIKRRTYEPCQERSVLQYFNQRHTYFVDRGCGPYQANQTLGYMCRSQSQVPGNAAILRVLSLIILYLKYISNPF